MNKRVVQQVFCPEKHGYLMTDGCVIQPNLLDVATKRGLIYLASPYSAEDCQVEHERYLEVVQATAKLLDLGYEIFSPIAHTHIVSQYITNNTHDFWMGHDLKILAKCDTLFVLTLDGWDRSTGVLEEIEFAYNHGIPVFKVSMESIMREFKNEFN